MASISKKLILFILESSITLDIIDQSGKMGGFKISCYSELLLPSVECLKYYGGGLLSCRLFTDATCTRNVIITKSPLVYLANVYHFCVKDYTGTSNKCRGEY